MHCGEKWKDVTGRITRYLLFMGEVLFLEKPRGLDFTMRDTGLYRRSAGKYHGHSKTAEKKFSDSEAGRAGFLYAGGRTGA